MFKHYILPTFISAFFSISVYSQANRFDVIIDEIMADPNPVVGLPNAEFIELKNTSSRTINLSGWKINTTSTTSSPFPDYNLLPGSYLILCSGTHAAAFSSFGNVLPVGSFPAISNNGTILSINNSQGTLIHAVSFNSEYYRNALKAGGGWSLEMIDTNYPCSDKNNWKASTDLSGGTPGRLNSVDAFNPDPSPPQLLRSYSTDSSTIILIFNKSLDSALAANITHYSIDNDIHIITAIPLGPLFTQVKLFVGQPMTRNIIYNITVTDITDCSGNSIGVYNKAITGYADNPAKNDLVINEILFNPKQGGADYIELFNKSNKILNAGKLFIANRDAFNNLNDITKITTDPYFIFPGSYLVITTDLESLQKSYFVKDPLSVIEMSSMPSLPDDKGAVVLTDNQANVIDEVSYSKEWHLPLIADAQGISLERINPSAISQDRMNWHSAASTAGYGTPGYINSQYKSINGSNITIEIMPKVFSPDNDGNDDVTAISYNVDAPGFVANINIFDASGRLVRYLVKNSLLGLKGNWNWDGTGENGQKLPAGIYIVFTELFNLEGKKKQYKNTVILTRRM